MENMPVIRCPACGQEYIPSEIFIPSVFFGKQTDIIKNDSGVIQCWLGDDMCLEEKYTCDNCGTTFTVEAELNFKTSTENKDFEEEYTSSFTPASKLVLDEGGLFDQN